MFLNAVLSSCIFAFRVLICVFIEVNHSWSCLQQFQNDVSLSDAHIPLLE